MANPLFLFFMKSRKSYIEKLVEQGEHQQQDFKFEISDSKKLPGLLLPFLIPMVANYWLE